jgi:hypothetical protein
MLEEVDTVSNFVTDVVFSLPFTLSQCDYDREPNVIGLDEVGLFDYRYHAAAYEVSTD